MKNIKYINIFFFCSIFFSSFVNVNAQDLKTINDLMTIDSEGKIIYTNPVDSKQYKINTIEDLKKILQPVIDKEKPIDIIIEDDMQPFSNEVKSIPKNENLLDTYKIINLINTERDSRGLSVLSKDKILTKTAEEHCLDMMDNNYFSHNDKSGKNPKTRATLNGSAPGVITEIIYWTNTKKIDMEISSIEAQNWWMDDKPHMLNITNKTFKNIGAAVCKNKISSGYKNYFVVMFHN